MRVLIVQPPFTQLNAPYPAAWYLEAFLSSRGLEATAEDHSIALFRRLFSREGLGLLFEVAERNAQAAEAAGLPPPDEASASQLARYRSYRPLWEAWIEDLIAFLSGEDPAFAHRLAAAAEFPRGARAEAFLESRGGRASAEDAPRLATLLLEDLVDFVSYGVDPALGAGRYGDRLARSRGDFGELEAALNPRGSGADASGRPREGSLVELFYRPFLRERFARLAGELAPAAGARDLLLCLTVPFPGSLLGALACAEEARSCFGQRVLIVMGGGYVSTELRSLADPRLFDYVDRLVFDAGYGALEAILRAETRAGGQGDSGNQGDPGTGLRSTMLRAADGRVRAVGFDRTGESEAELAALEEEALRTIQPDWSGLDPHAYLRIVEGANPMHRLWSDTPWLKYRLAHGCYWRRCAFCDTGLDYVARYLPSDGAALFAAAESAAAATGLRGIHFVDEALPMAGLLDFARRNRERAAAGRRPFSFWGNARFDAAWTPDRARLLAASGLVALSGGIEVASERGLAMTDKGFDLPRLVRSLLAIRSAGILVHAYLIYGFPGQDRASIVESLEIVRQLFAAGLVDSAFWHRFVLTRHSRMEEECLRGLRPGLKPIDRGGSFANNDLEFEGEEAYESYGPLLDAAVAAWMGGEELERRADAWLDTAISERGRRRKGGTEKPAGLPAPDLVEGLLDAAEALLEARPLPERGRAHWLAGSPIVEASAGEANGTTRLSWAFRGLMCELELPPEGAAAVAEALGAAAPPSGLPLGDFIAVSGLAPASRYFAELRAAGLVVT
jgi:hypothetical protein